MEGVKPYRRRAVYYETDKMGIIHHSNYIRWFEEARLDFMDQVGVNYARVEEAGVIIPVTDASCDYVESVHFDEEVDIHVKCTYCNGVRFKFTYEIRFADTGKVAARGKTGHCFLNDQMKPINLKKYAPEIYETIMKSIEPM